MRPVWSERISPVFWIALRRIAVGAAFVLPLLASDGRAGVATVVDSIPSPLPTPRFDLDFDATTRTLWGIENSSATANIMNFTLEGTFLSGFLTANSYNSVGIAVNQAAGDAKRIYYWQNLQQALRETTADGTPLGTTILPFGYQVLVYAIGFDPVAGRAVLPHAGLADPAIESGFDFVAPGVGIESTAPFDFAGELNMGLFLGIALSAESYWVLGPSVDHDQIAQIDRASLTVVDVFPLPDSAGGQSYHGLARDPETGRFYTNYSDDVIRLLELPEPATALAGAASVGSLLALARRRRLAN